MEHIIISNRPFEYNVGCSILKLKYDKCPLPELEEFWDDIKPAQFKDIAKLENIEQRQVGILLLGIERLVKEVGPILIDKKTLNKTTTYINEKGKLITKKFKDVYQLYKITADKLNDGITDRWRRRLNDAYYVKCKDTSTNREYLIFVDIAGVARTNNVKSDDVNAIQAIAWTIQTDVEEGNIEKIIRQGDCIMIKPINKKTGDIRHLTEKEYVELLVAES